MKTDIFAGQLPCTITQAEAVVVAHPEDYLHENTAGRALYAFVHVLHGQLDFQFGEQDHRLLRPGQTIYLPQGCRYRCRYHAPLTQVVILQFDLHRDSSLPLDRPIVLTENTSHLFRDYNAPYGVLDSFFCAARIYDLLGILTREAPAIPRKYRRLQPALEVMAQELTVHRPIGEYAALCGMSEPGFRRSFREYQGMSPVEYRNSLRLLHARKLIASGEYSVEEAARQSGFDNLSFFYRLFRRKFAVPPGKL